VKEPESDWTFAGPEMRKLRELAGFTQTEWAARLFTTKMTISRIERGANRVSPQTLHIARLTADPRYRAEWLQTLPKRR